MPWNGLTKNNYNMYNPYKLFKTKFDIFKMHDLDIKIFQEMIKLRRIFNYSEEDKSGNDSSEEDKSKEDNQLF